MSRLLTHEPVVVTRATQHCVAVRRRVTMQTFDEVVDRIPEILGWLAARGVAPAGPPFLRYLGIDMARELEVEAGVPVADVVPVDDDADVDGELRAGVLPAGRYVTLAQVGHPDALVEVTAELLEWGDRQGLVWDSEPSSDGERWGCRLESYLTDPREEPDMNRWTVELAFRLAD